MTQQPNIFLITTDQQHFSTLGVLNDKIKTPNIDRLCRAGTRFDRAYCASPVCTPSRGSIITGLYPSHHGAWTIGVKLPENLPTLGALLSTASYHTALIGKAHFQPLAGDSIERQPVLRDLDFWRGFKGPWYGFDHCEMLRNHADESHVGQHYAIWLEEQGLKDWKDYFQPVEGETSTKAPARAPNAPYWAREQRIWALPEELHYTRWIGERSIARINECHSQGEPFFLWASFPDPHPPYTVPEPWASMYSPQDMDPGSLVPGEHDRNPPHFAMTQQKAPDFAAWHDPFEAHGCDSHLYSQDDMRADMAVYYGMISFMDDQIGKILDRLDALGLAENTLIVFTSDHGHFLGQHGLVAKGPFHYEDMLRVPFIVCWPGKVPAGEVSSALQSLVDLTPTFLEAAGLEIPAAMQGVSQLSCWFDPSQPVREFAICENRHNPVMPHVTSYITDQYKISVYRQGDEGEIFDLANDPGEVHNLWSDPKAALLRGYLLHQMVQGFLSSEPMKMPRVAHA